MLTDLRSRWLLPALPILAALAGCQTGEPVVRPLPPPVVQVPRIPRTTPLPRPTPAPRQESRDLANAVIVVDAGHGGKDPGAPARGSGQRAEKHIVLDIALKLEDQLRRRGARVIMTRTSDRFIPLEERAAIAERSHADLFVSIHVNASERGSVSGLSVHIYDHASSASLRAALRMTAVVKRAGIECRGVSRDNFHVLREHSRPAILIECGFITNAAEARKLNTDAYRARLAETIAGGIASYFSS